MPGTYEAERLIHPFTGEEIFYPTGVGLGGKHNTHNPYHVQYTDSGPRGQLRPRHHGRDLVRWDRRPRRREEAQQAR